MVLALPAFYSDLLLKSSETEHYNTLTEQRPAEQVKRCIYNVLVYVMSAEQNAIEQKFCSVVSRADKVQYKGQRRKSNDTFIMYLFTFKSAEQNAVEQKLYSVSSRADTVHVVKRMTFVLSC